MHLFKPTELVREFSRSVRKEIDFTIEAANTDAFYQRFAESSKVRSRKFMGIHKSSCLDVGTD